MEPSVGLGSPACLGPSTRCGVDGETSRNGSDLEQDYSSWSEHDRPVLLARLTSGCLRTADVGVSKSSRNCSPRMLIKEAVVHFSLSIGGREVLVHVATGALLERKMD